MKRFWQVTAAGAVAGGLLAIPAGASASATLSTPLAPCYSAMPPKGVPSIPISLSGGGAGDAFQVNISDPKAGLGSLGFVAGTFDGSGDGSATLTDIYPPGNESINPSPGLTADLSVTETMSDGSQPNTPLGTTLITNRALNLGFSFTSNDKAHEVSVSGTQFANQRLYGFVVHNGKLVERVSLGKSNVCGFAERKLALISKHTRTGKYIFYVNSGTKLNKKAAISEAYRVEVF
jgi:hypothetical protein